MFAGEVWKAAPGVDDSLPRSPFSAAPRSGAGGTVTRSGFAVGTKSPSVWLEGFR